MEKGYVGHGKNPKRARYAFDATDPILITVIIFILGHKIRELRKKQNDEVVNMQVE